MASRVFISYQRQISSDIAGRIFDRLAAEFGETTVFMDAQSIAPGDTFADAIRSALKSCFAVIVLIGPGWANLRDERGARRIADVSDYVRLEIEIALQEGVPILPLLHGHSSMPVPDDLPESIGGLAAHNVLSLRHLSFDADFRKASNQLKTLLDQDYQHRLDVAANVYRSLGYTVQKNISIFGYYAPLIAESNMPGVGFTRLIVAIRREPKAPIKSGEITKLAEGTEPLMATGKVTGVVLVSETGKLASRRVATGASSFVRVTTLTDLQQSLFDMKHEMLAYIQEYERQDIFNEFIPLTLTQRKAYKASGIEVSDEMEAPQTKVGARHFFERIFDGHIGRFVIILGDFGAGKTTLLTRLRYEIARRHLASTSSQKVFYVSLRRFANFTNYDDFIQEMIKDNFLHALPFSLFRAELAGGAFIILLDGFDEISAKTTPAERARLLMHFYDLVAAGATIILTSRPAYFVDIDEINKFISSITVAQESPQTPNLNVPVSPRRQMRIAQIERLRSNLALRYSEFREFSPIDHYEVAIFHVDPLDEKQADNYLRRFSQRFRSACGVDWKGVKEFLLSVYDLRDLMRRPILLATIKDTVLSGELDLSARGIKAGVAWLYETYTSANFDRDWKKGRFRRVLSIPGRLSFCEAVAIHMLRGQSLVVSQDDLQRISIEIMRRAANLAEGVGGQLRLDDVMTDGRLSTFITLDSEGYRFTHKSS